MSSTGALSRLSDLPGRQVGFQFYQLGIGDQLASTRPATSTVEPLLRAEVVVDDGLSDKSKLESSSLASLS